MSSTKGQVETPHAFAYWLDRIGRENPPSGEINAFNIGIFESPGGYTVYLIGSKEYDSQNDDWACQEDFTPRERYLELPLSFVSEKNWQQIEKGVIELVLKFLKSNEGSGHFLANADVVTVGFDDGVLVRVK